MAHGDRRALAARPHLRGRVVFRLTLDPEGRVSAAQVPSSTLSDPELEECLLGRLRQVTFVNAHRREAVVDVPVVFKPDGE